MVHACNPSTLRGRGRRISEFETNLVYRVSSRTAKATQRNPVSKKKALTDLPEVLSSIPSNQEVAHHHLKCRQMLSSDMSENCNSVHLYIKWIHLLKNKIKGRQMKRSWLSLYSSQSSNGNTENQVSWWFPSLPHTVRQDPYLKWQHKPIFGSCVYIIIERKDDLQQNV